MNILLYNPRSSKTRKPVLPMSLLAIGAILEGQQDYRIIDGNLEDDPYTALSTAIGNEASKRILAMTVMPGPQLEDATPLSRRLKARFPDLTIVWGGYFPSQHWQTCLLDGGVDFIVRKHGEQAFVELIEQLQSHQFNYEDIKGLAWSHKGEPRAIPSPTTPDPGKLPEWNLDRVDIEKYVRQTFLGRRTLGVHTSYGCPYFCNFCAVVNMVEGRWLAWSPERVERIVRSYTDRWAVDAVEFYDNNFFVSENRVRECADRLKPLNISWWGEARIDTMMRFSDATWKAMAESGLKMVFLGAESGSQDTLDRMSKGGSVSPEKTLEIVKYMKHWDIIHA